MSRFRLAATTSAQPIEPSTIPDGILATLDTPAGNRSDRQSAGLARYFARTADETGRKLYAPSLEHAAGKPEFPKTTAAVLTTHERKTHSNYSPSAGG